MGYNGDYLEGLVFTAKKGMDSIKKYKTFNLSLLQNRDITSMNSEIDKACKIVKSINFHRYKTARKYSSNSAISKLDHFLAIDDVMYNDELNLTIGIDWTTNYEDIDYKVNKHNELQEAIGLIVDKTCVVYIEYEDVLDTLNEAKLSKAIYKILKRINKEAKKYNFAGFIHINAQDLI